MCQLFCYRVRKNYGIEMCSDAKIRVIGKSFISQVPISQKPFYRPSDVKLDFTFYMCRPLFSLHWGIHVVYRHYQRILLFAILIRTKQSARRRRNRLIHFNQMLPKTNLKTRKPGNKFLSKPALKLNGNTSTMPGNLFSSRFLASDE